LSAMKERCARIGATPLRGFSLPETSLGGAHRVLGYPLICHGYVPCGRLHCDDRRYGIRVAPCARLVQAPLRPSILHSVHIRRQKISERLKWLAAIPRSPAEDDLEARGNERELIRQRRPADGRLALPCLVPVFRDGPAELYVKAEAKNA
jgi:hypothetical protein